VHHVAVVANQGLTRVNVEEIYGHQGGVVEIGRDPA